jgi:hypothetical protein
VSVNGTLVEVEMCTFTLESSHYIFSKCPTLTTVQVSNLALTHRLTANGLQCISANNTLTLTHLCKKKRTFQTCYVAPNCWMVQGVHFTDNIHIRYLPFIPAYNRIYSTNNREVITEQQQQYVLHIRLSLQIALNLSLINSFYFEEYISS